jgi:hypothetical protein
VVGEGSARPSGTRVVGDTAAVVLGERILIAGT